jgi:hypothetical protein
MADYQSDRTGANIDQILDNADNGNIGKESPSIVAGDIGLVTKAGFYNVATTATNTPVDGATATLLVIAYDGGSTVQIWTQRTTDNMQFRRKAGAGWQPWREIYHDNGNGVTAAEAATAIKGAKDGNIGLSSLTLISDLDALTANGVYRVGASTLNVPAAEDFDVHHANSSATVATQLAIGWLSSKVYFRFKRGTWSAWQELYHTGNTGVVEFATAGASAGENKVSLSVAGGGKCQIARSGTSSLAAFEFLNSNGIVGQIATSGTSTAYVTTSDNRLKLDQGKPSDEEINAKFDDIYETFTCFNWKTDENGEKAWGFLAHDVIDKGLDFGSEGEGPRNLNIGDVYETIPEETEERPVMETVTDEDGNETEQQATDENGNLLFETVVVKEAVEKRVSPAGVDQSKVVPYLVAKIEQQDRIINELLQRIGALEAK